MVAVVLHHPSQQFPPNMSTQQCLVGTVARSAAATEWVVHDSRPYGFPRASALCQPGTPETAKHGLTVKGVVSHHVQCLFTLEPLLHRLHLAQCDSRVEVSRQEKVDLGIEGGEKTPHFC